jgi:hypothetical protein
VKHGLLRLRHPTHHDKDWPIRPSRRVREGLILSEETNIERILFSPALKGTKQSVIVGKLSAYRRKNRSRRSGTSVPAWSATRWSTIPVTHGFYGKRGASIVSESKARRRAMAGSIARSRNAAIGRERREVLAWIESWGSENERKPPR